MPPARSLARPPASASFSTHSICAWKSTRATPAIAAISGEMDIASVPWLREALLLAIRRHGPAISVDLHEVTFLDCSGINVLLATARRARLEGGWMRVVRPSAKAWHIITLLGLQHVLTRDHEH